MKLNGDPTLPVAVSALVKAGAWPTMTVRVWVASGLIPLLAVMVRLAVPVAVPVPERRAVPLPLSVNVSPAGSVPDSVIFGVGEPVVVIATAPAWFSVKSAVDELVMVGAVAAFTVMVRFSVARLPEELVAEIVTG